MRQEEVELLSKRKQGFDEFYKALIPTLVEFVGAMGVQPAHEVLNNATHFAPYLDKSLRDMAVNSEKARGWLLLRVGQFIGEFFVQKYGGCWYVNEIEGSRYFARYVVGRFSKLTNMVPMLDPFEVAQTFVDSPTPRQLEVLLGEVDAELIEIARKTAPSA
jgi:hypothetical protein